MRGTEIRAANTFPAGRTHRPRQAQPSSTPARFPAPILPRRLLGRLRQEVFEGPSSILTIASHRGIEKLVAIGMDDGMPKLARKLNCPILRLRDPDGLRLAALHRDSH